jgi:hypothetical protein
MSMFVHGVHAHVHVRVYVNVLVCVYVYFHFASTLEPFGPLISSDIRILSKA